MLYLNQKWHFGSKRFKMAILGGLWGVFKCENIAFLDFFWIFSFRFLKYTSCPTFHVESMCNHHLPTIVHMMDHISAIFCLFWAKLTKKVIFTHKYGQKYHFRANIMYQPLCQIKSICVGKFSEKKIFELGKLHYLLWPFKVCTEIYIWAYMAKMSFLV